MKTADVLDEYGDRASVCLLPLRSFGAPAFSGPISTVRCFEDNVLVRAAAEEPGALLHADADGVVVVPA